MRRKLLFFSLSFLVLLCACKNDNVTTGASVLPESDAILVSVDTFGIRSKMNIAEAIYSTPDSLLLGEFDDLYGTLHADILTQLACPEGFEYPETSELDSVCLFLFYNTWYGDGKSPLSIEAFALDKSTLYYEEDYKTDLLLDEYWSGEDSTCIMTDGCVVVAAEPTDSITSSYYIRIRLTDEYAQKFFAIRNFSSQTTYNDLFKGFYIRTAFGGSTVLHITDINLGVYYHYRYLRAGATDSTTISTSKAFYANSEIRKVNRVVYPDKEERYNALISASDTVDYIASPARFYARLRLPVGEMMDNIEVELPNKRPYVNRALLRVDVLNVYRGSLETKTRDDWGQPANYMMLVKEDEVDNILIHKKYASLDIAVNSVLLSGVDSLGNTVYYYSYDLGTMLTKELRKPIDQRVDTLNMLLVPVEAETAASTTGTYYSSIKPCQTITSTKIRSAQNDSLPMRLEVTCSGF